jgi:hypothetical protein
MLLMKTGIDLTFASSFASQRAFVRLIASKSLRIGATDWKDQEGREEQKKTTPTKKDEKHKKEQKNEGDESTLDKSLICVLHRPLSSVFRHD